MLIEKLFIDRLTETLDQAGLLYGTQPEQAAPYRVYCPACSAPVVRQELLNKGCYLCGWQPVAGSQNGK